MSENLVTEETQTHVVIPANVTRKTRTSFTLAPDLLEFCRTKAEANKVSVSSVIEDAIRAAKDL